MQREGRDGLGGAVQRDTSSGGSTVEGATIRASGVPGLMWSSLCGYGHTSGVSDEE